MIPVIPENRPSTEEANANLRTAFQIERERVCQLSDIEKRQALREMTSAQAPSFLNPDQSAIWHIFEAEKIRALKKNADYGSSVFKKPRLCPQLSAGDTILVRISDKLCRIESLMARPGRDPLVKDEALDDTMRDLATYCLLWVLSQSKG